MDGNFEGKHIAARNLRRIRREMGLTQEQLSELSGVSKDTISDIENENSEMKIVTLLKLCDALKVTANDMLYENVDEEIVKFDEELKNALKFKAYIKEGMKELE